jgi:hypothetical protein
LGAGATAAISPVGTTFPTAENFFSSNNEWNEHLKYYPHLSLICNKIGRFENQINLKNTWLFIDTLLKYHLATRKNDSYNSDLLRLRYIRYKNSVRAFPNYLAFECLNKSYIHLCEGMQPLYSISEKQIYDISDRSDPVSYFLVLAGWELKYLAYKTYSPHKKTNDLYLNLLQKLQDKNISVISFNYDIYFEKACKIADWSLQLVDVDEMKSDKDDKDVTYICKPHGGWNIRHINDSVEPCVNLWESVEDSSFDRKQDLEERPAMIPYFSNPDEIGELHGVVFANVGEYFKKQREVMIKMFENADKIVSIGYSFSEDDKHVRKAIEKCGQNRKEKKLFCVLKESDDDKAAELRCSIKKLFDFTNEYANNFKYCGNGFNDESIKEIAKFFKEDMK